MGKIVPPVYAHESIFCGPPSRISAQHPASEGERALNHGASGTEFFGDVLLFLGSFLGDKMGKYHYIYILYNIIYIYMSTYMNDEYVYDMYMYIHIYRYISITYIDILVLLMVYMIYIYMSWDVMYKNNNINM